MRTTDVVIVGGGLAGSTAAAMLARDGCGVVLVDPHSVYPPDLRCEKLDCAQVETLRRTGLADLVLPAATFDGGCWVARFGRVVDKRPGEQYGILYDTLVNTVRAAIPACATFICSHVTAIANSPDRQIVTLLTGEKICARLVIVAHGLNVRLLRGLGITREDLSKCHTITFAFDLQPVGKSSFNFPALTYHPQRTADRFAYLTLFPVGHTMRANLIVYREMDDPWVREMRQRPEAALSSIMPKLSSIIGLTKVVGPVKVRSADLYVTHGYLQPGIVLVGDAFATTCPAAGTGADKVFTDVERLCNIYVPRWLASNGMGAEKISAFYADPVKVKSDRHSFDRAFSLRSLSIDEGLTWRAGRWARFLAWQVNWAVRTAVTRMAGRSPGSRAYAAAARRALRRAPGP